MTANTSNPSTEQMNELVITRTFDAPRDLVYQAWTEPERLMKWWGPGGFTGTASEVDLRVGGNWRACMRSPEGVEHWSHGVYREIEPPERLTMTFTWDEPDATETLIALTFENDGARTRMTFRQSPFDSAESRDGHREGWTGSFNDLGAYVDELSRNRNN